MRRELRFASALSGQEAERDHFSLSVVETVSRIVIAEAVACEPAVDVAAFFRTGFVEFLHAVTEDIHLSLNALFQAVFHRRRRLTRQRQLDIQILEDFVGRSQEREDPADTAVVCGLIDDLLDFDRSQTEVERCRNDRAKFVDALTSDKRRENRHEAGPVIQIVLIDDLVEGEIIQTFDIFGICHRHF